MSEITAAQSPANAAQLIARLASLDKATLAAVLQATAAVVDRSPGLAVLTATTHQQAREAIGVANPNPAERYFRSLYMR